MRKFLLAATIVLLSSPALGGDGVVGDPVGVGCLGEGAVVFNITWADFQDQYAPDEDGDGAPDYFLLWIQGQFNPTSDKTPCDLVNGGD